MCSRAPRAWASPNGTTGNRCPTCCIAPIWRCCMRNGRGAIGSCGGRSTSPREPYSDFAGVDGFGSEDEDDEADEPSVRFFFLSLPFLKSVSYQPLPERRNEGAVTWRFTASAPHCGQADGSGSAIFCRRSKWWPQAAHSKA